MGTAVIGGALVASLATPAIGSWLVAAALGGTLVFCAGGAVTGYRLEGDQLVIERVGFDKVVSLKNLRKAQHDHKLIHGALRVGNGGLFVFSGYFWSKKLGWFRLHGNDILGRAVLLVTDEGKWMITPENPEAFVAAAKKLIDN